MGSYTPDEPGMREAYRFHTRQISDHRYIEQGKPVMSDAEIDAEFDRFIAKTKAEAIRAARDEIMPPYNFELRPDGSEDVQAARYAGFAEETHSLLSNIADRIEGEQA